MPGLLPLAGGLSAGRAPRLAVCAACLVALARVVAAEPIVVSQRYDFRTDDGRSTGGAWLPGHSGHSAVANRWRWTGSPRLGTGRWAETPAVRSGWRPGVESYLTSPVIDVKALLGGSADTFRLSLAHRFNFDRNALGQPVAGGEIAYSLDGGRFIPIPRSAFTIGGILIGQSAGFRRGVYVPTVASLDFRDSGITFDTIQFRLIEASFGTRCPPRSRWDVQSVQADFAAPEPGGFVLAGIGCALAAWHCHRLKAARAILSGPGFSHSRRGNPSNPGRVGAATAL